MAVHRAVASKAVALLRRFATNPAFNVNMVVVQHEHDLVPAGLDGASTKEVGAAGAGAGVGGV